MGPIQDIDQHEKNLEVFLARTHPERRKQNITAIVETSRQRFDTPGLTGTINVAPDTFLKQVEAQAAKQYDDQLTADAKALEASQRDLSVALADVITVVTQLPDPLRVEDNTPAGDHTHAIKRVGLLIEREHEERRLAGKTVLQVAELYEQADDRREAVLKWMIEDQQRRGWPDVRLVESADFRGVERLKHAITQAQRARLEQQHPDLAKAEAKLAKLRSSAVLSFLLNDARTRVA